MTTLGETLPQLLDDCTELIIEESDPQKIKQLREQQKKIAADLQKLIDKNVSQDTAEYEAVTKGIKEAASSVQAAMDDINKMTDTIQKISNVANLVSKLAAKVS